MVYKNDAELLNNEALTEKGGILTIKKVTALRKTVVDNIVDTMILSDSVHMKRLCYWVAYSCATAVGVIPSSIHSLYEAEGKGEISGFTVPAMNLRTLTYDLARAVFRAAKKIKAGAFIFEIAKSEIGYTDQRPLEYSSVIMLAAVKENYKGPVFFQGDHFQVKAASFLKDRDKELTPLKTLIEEAIAATGALGIKDMGKVMKEVNLKVSGRADGKLVSDMVRGRLSQPEP